VLDLRNEQTIYTGNRFMVYAMYPEVNISMHVLWGLKKQNTVLAFGKSIINRTSNANISELMQQYGGSGHENASTCQIENNRMDEVLQTLIAKITTDD
jgi:nanoRNase/pAp phosphatase (c-di-AMP/oligoRNAs hydrolase)